MKNRKEVVALIPVREGSQRVKKKNFKPFANEKSLLNLKIKQLQESDCFDKIYISSDSDLAKDITHEEGASFLYRDPYMCGHEARLYEYNNYMLNTIPGNPVVAWTMTTAPIFDDYKDVVLKYLSMDYKLYDSLITVIPHNGFLVDSNAKPINCSFGHWHLLTQELREAFEITGGVYMAKKSDQIKWSYWFGPKAYLYQTSKMKSIDVDDEEDFKIAEILHSSAIR